MVEHLVCALAQCDVSPSRRRLPRSPLFPYTTLFRSAAAASGRVVPGSLHVTQGEELVACWDPGDGGWLKCFCSRRAPRSEEHTSELQSRSDLVCRFLIAKKNHLRGMVQTGSILLRTS